MEGTPSGECLSVTGRLVASVRERHIDASKVKQMQAPVSDLGEGGMFIQMHEPPPKGTILEVEFDLPDSAGRTKVLGIVRWREKAGPRAGVGVRFAPIGQGERSDIRQIVRRGGRRVSAPDVGPAHNSPGGKPEEEAEGTGEGGE